MSCSTCHTQPIKKHDNLSNCTCPSLKDEIAKLQTSQSQLNSIVLSNKQIIKDMIVTMPNNNMNIYATKPIIQKEQPDKQMIDFNAARPPRLMIKFARL